MDMRLENNLDNLENNMMRMRMMTKREAEGEADGEAGYGYQTYSETPFHKSFAGAYYTPDIHPVPSVPAVHPVPAVPAVHPVPAVPAVFNRGYRYRAYKMDWMLANVKYFLWLNIFRQKTSTSIFATLVLP